MDRVISQVYLKDTHYRIYGQLNIYADGWQEVKQVPGYSIKGYYNPEKNWTTTRLPKTTLFRSPVVERTLTIT